MKNLPNFIVEINGRKGEIFVSDNDGGRYMCVFVKNGTEDFTEDYKAYGFMVWTTAATHSQIEFFPIKLKEKTKLTQDVMRQMWAQISDKIKL